jgi:molecular chaperone GrpE
VTDPTQPGGPGGSARDQEREQEEQSRGPIIRDKRRLDPETGAVREPSSTWQPAQPAQPGQPVGQPPGGGTPPVGQPAPGEAPGGVPGDVALLEQQLAERTSDLQRVQAEYANYRRRVERDREATRELAVSTVLTNFLPVLDDIGRAREHDELEGGFRSVGEALEQIVEKLGLTRFGEAGDPFDPTVHEALTHTHSAEVTEPTCVQIFSPGYRIGDRIVRPARVGVADPE